MRLRLRLTVTIAVLTALGIGCAFAAVHAAFAGLQRRRLDDAILSIARAEAAEAPSSNFHFSDRPGPAANDVGPLAKYGIIYDEAGNVLTATAPFDRSPPARTTFGRRTGEPFDFRFDQQELRGVVVPIPGYPGRSLVLAASRDDVEGDDAFLARAMAIAFGIAIAWASFVAYWIAGRLTRDHVAIATVARNVARGDLTARVASRSPDPELAQLGRDIDDMVERLGELMVAQRRFTAHAAHELRSPLTALYAELQHALRKERDADGYKNAITNALHATTRLRMLADDLLVLASAQHEGPTPQSPVSLREALEEARRLACGPAGREVHVEIAAEATARVAGRDGDITRLFRNLIENAIRHSPDGGTVRIQAAPGHDDAIEVELTDEGPGVAVDDREHVFEPFYRSKTARSVAGSGLGLGIAREIARAHGGDVTLDASSTTGARFVVRLRSGGRDENEGHAGGEREQR